MEMMERRVSESSPEIRAESDDSKRLIGHAAVFNSFSQDLGGFREVIQPGAFQSSLGNDIRALLNHDSNYVLGRTSAGTLVVSEDERGLLVQITPPDTTFGRDLMVSVARGDVTQMSFGFRVRNGGESWAEDNGIVTRTLTDIELLEVSSVTFPAYTATDIAVRSFKNWQKEQENINKRNEAQLIRIRMKLDLLNRQYN